MIYYAVDKRDEALTHYGVLGMKWGVRKSKIKASLRKAKKNISKAADAAYDKHQYKKKRKAAVQQEVAKRLNDEHTPGNTITAKKKRMQDLANRRTLTDAEIRQKLDRLRLEKQYKDAVMEDVSPVKAAIIRSARSVGEDAFKNVMKNGGALAVNSLASKGNVGKFLTKNGVDPKKVGNSLFGVQGLSTDTRDALQKENDRLQKEATNYELKYKVNNYRNGDFSSLNNKKKKK